MWPASLYPHAAPFRTHAFDVPGGHRLHVDEFGREDGLPALVLHGGPGSGVSPLQRRFFDPARYRVICPDQRGAGRSTPPGDTAHNTTAHLLDDLVTLRARLGVSRWLVVGGSWGATLAVLHAAAQPGAVSGLLLRSAFLARPADIGAFFEGMDLTALAEVPDSADTAGVTGAAGLAGPSDAPGRGDGHDPAEGPLAQLNAALLSDDATRRRVAARCWWLHELAASGRDTAEARAAGPRELDALVPRYRVQGHSLARQCGLPAPLLDRATAVPPVPTLLLHGTDDRVCPPAGARALHAALPGSRLQWVPDCGHDLAHPGMVDAMVRALDRYARHGRFGLTPGRRRAAAAIPQASTPSSA